MTKNKQQGLYWLITPLLFLAIAYGIFIVRGNILEKTTEDISEAAAAASEHKTLIVNTESTVDKVFLAVYALAGIYFIYGVPRGLYLLSKKEKAPKAGGDTKK